MCIRDRLSTHLGNGCPELIHRHGSPIWAQLASEQLSASLICDGFHLTPEFVRVAYGMKGRARCILITDSIHVSGLAPGAYELAGMPEMCIRDRDSPVRLKLTFGEVPNDVAAPLDPYTCLLYTSRCV